MIAVAGIDPGVKLLGLATPDGRVHGLKSRFGSKDPIRRLAELDRVVRRTLKTCPPWPDLVVVEGYVPARGFYAAVRAGEIGGAVRVAAFELGAVVVEVKPSALKRFATGHGNADKPAMIARALELGAVLSGPDAHDEADAYHARRLGRMGVGDLPVEHDHELEVVASLTWPAYPVSVRL